MTIKELVVSTKLKSTEKVENTVNTQERILVRSYTRYTTSGRYNRNKPLLYNYVQGLYSKSMSQLKYLETLSNSSSKVDSFLNFLERDIQNNPQNLQATDSDLISYVQSLFVGEDIDIDAPIYDED